MSSAMNNLSFPTYVFLSLAALLAASGCTSIKQREYAPFVRELDGKNFLEISIYPADYPDRLNETGSITQNYESHGEVFFQVFVRDKKKNKVGEHPHIQSIIIHSFSYQIGDEPPTVLVSDYEHNFWMQGNPRYEKRASQPVPYQPGGKVGIEVDFTLNGERYTFKGDMPAEERLRVFPTALVKQSI
jgi:hypothetical protein